MYHKSVLINEVIEYLAPEAGGIYVDATFGGGGHTRAILQAQPGCRVIALDVDQKALELNGPPLVQEFPERLQLIWGNFSHLKQLLKKQGVKQVNGILADFGTSQFQISHREGFSFNKDTPLDMRMSPAHTPITAADIVNQASEEELARIFYEFGEEYNSRKIAHAVVAYRRDRGRVVTTGQLADIVKSVIPPYSRHIHPATKVFQALRIVVNDELNAIKSLLAQSSDLLLEKGRLVFISFHSLEDRLVKQFFKNNSHLLRILTPKVVTASDVELAQNPSSRSAKLRAAEKLPTLAG